jgi:hypothetical protein
MVPIPNSEWVPGNIIWVAGWREESGVGATAPKWHGPARHPPETNPAPEGARGCAGRIKGGSWTLLQKI